MIKTPFSLSARDRDDLLHATLTIADDAGQCLMSFYNADWNAGDDILKTQIKADNSPVTAADRAAHRLIKARLQALTPGIAIISEENRTQPDIKPDGLFWSVDPLDGTKEFLHRTGAFTVNIALLDRFTPVLGVMRNPAFDQSWFSVHNGPACRIDGQKAPVTIQTRKAPQAGTLTTLFNAKHGDAEAYRLARQQLGLRGVDVPSTPDGKSGVPRAIQVAEGLADAFVDCGKNLSLRGGNGYSWDYAPNWLILKNAGGMMAEITSGREPQFRNPTERMNAYIAFGDRRLGKKAFPSWEKHC